MDSPVDAAVDDRGGLPVGDDVGGHVGDTVHFQRRKLRT